MVRPHRAIRSYGRPIHFVWTTLLGLALLQGCSPVAFYEKGQLQDPIMALSPDPTESHAFQKIYYSREGSVGGIGVGAGGGCGCY